jgi:hypothetical protein
MNLKKATNLILKQKFELNGSVFYYLSILGIAIITVYPWFNTGLSCGDDMATYIITRFGKVVANAKDLAELHGRFQYLFTLPIQSLPFVWDSIVIIKLFQVLPIVLALFLFNRVVRYSTGSQDLSALYVLLFLVTAQVSRHTSLFLNYPFCFSFSFSLLLCSYLLLMRYQQTKKYWILLVSALIYAIGLLFFEAYLVFLAFVTLFVIYRNVQAGEKGFKLVKKAGLQILPYLVVVICFLVVYVLYRQSHPSQYDGNKMSEGTAIIKSFFLVLWRLSTTAFPLTVYDSTKYLFAMKSEIADGFRNVVPYLIANARIEWIVKGVLVFGLAYYLLVRMPKTAYRTILVGMLAAVLLTFSPHFLLALTVKYIFYVTTQGMLGYVTTFFSLFGIVLFLSFLTVLLLNLTGPFTVLRHLTALVFSIGLVLCGFLTDFSNYYITRDVERASVRLYAMDELVKSDLFKAIPQYSNMAGTDLWINPSTQAGGLTVQNFEWTYYIGAKSGLSQFVYNNDSIFLSKVRESQAPCYKIVYNQSVRSDDAMLAVALLNRPGENDKKVDSVSTKILVLYYSQEKYFTVSFKKQPSVGETKTQLRISHITDEVDPGEYGEFTLFNTNDHARATIFTIEGPPVLIRSIRISNIVNPQTKLYYL